LRDDTESDVVTIRECDKKSLIDIQKELNDRLIELKNYNFFDQLFLKVE
jgi:hypothetical protein